ncbi:hypothetical protein, partial [Methylocucumis oryzae]
FWYRSRTVFMAFGGLVLVTALFTGGTQRTNLTEEFNPNTNSLENKASVSQSTQVEPEVDDSKIIKRSYIIEDIKSNVGEAHKNNALKPQSKPGLEDEAKKILSKS